VTDTQTAVAERNKAQEDAQRNLARFVDSMRPQLARVLVKAEAADRLARIATTAARQNPRLTECTPLSLAGALLTAAVLDLEPNTPEQLCYLVPYRDRKTGNTEAQLQVGYQGYCKLFYQHPLAELIYAEAVYPEDDFAWQRGTSPRIDHDPHPERRAEDSRPTHYYAVAFLVGRERPAFVVLTAAEVKKLRQGKEGPSGDIEDPQRWMERKTAIRQLVKLLPKSVKLAQAARVDESSGTELYRAAQAERADRPALEQGDGPPADTPPVEDPPPGGEGL
jgi:recombination protein RecT